MEQRISLVTLGVRDISRARAFYEDLGWEAKGDGDDAVFFQAGGMVLGLWDRARLAEDSGIADDGGWGGVTLAYNTGSTEEVDTVMEDARRAGAGIGREAGKTCWGGYSGIFLDPDGHPWDAFNPAWTLREDGSVRL